MTDDHAGNLPRNPPISVSPDNPCPFLRAVAGEVLKLTRKPAPR